MPGVTIVHLTEDDVPGAKLGGDIEQYTNVLLKRWLQCRGLKSTGKRDELLKRCKDAISCKKEIDPAIDNGKWYDKKCQDLKSSAANLTRDCHILPITGWEPFHPDKLPQLFNYGNIFHWLVESLPNLSVEEKDTGTVNNNDVVTEKPLRRGRQYVSSGFVSDINVKVNSKLVHFKAIVRASMKNTSYTVTSSLSVVSGAVRDASCHCKASSLSRCSHVAALLLSLSDCVGKQSPACTDLPCKWKKGKKSTPTTINDAVYGQDMN
ncbi:hypothetical protein ScPMuIL_001932 [Solemya velum]